MSFSGSMTIESVQALNIHAHGSHPKEPVALVLMDATHLETTKPRRMVLWFAGRPIGYVVGAPRVDSDACFADHRAPLDHVHVRTTLDVILDPDLAQAPVIA
jgi:hypothetical protein